MNLLHNMECAMLFDISYWNYLIYIFLLKKLIFSFHKLTYKTAQWYIVWHLCETNKLKVMIIDYIVSALLITPRLYYTVVWEKKWSWQNDNFFKRDLDLKSYSSFFMKWIIFYFALLANH